MFFPGRMPYALRRYEISKGLGVGVNRLIDLKL